MAHVERPPAGAYEAHWHSCKRRGKKRREVLPSISVGREKPKQIDSFQDMALLAEWGGETSLSARWQAW